MRQTWHDLLFAHWALEPDAVRAAMPPPLRAYLDTYDGKAYIGVIPFWMSKVRGRGVPPLPTAGTFPELNVRTYVTIDGKPGVYFFSLDAASLLAVVGARIGFSLRYYWAEMKCEVGEEDVHYLSRRLQSPKPADFRGSYKAVGAATQSAPGSLEHFVTERYCLYAVRGEKVLRANIHHHPWPLQRAEAQIEVNSMASASGINLPNKEPVLHFAKRMDVLVWMVEKAGGGL